MIVMLISDTPDAERAELIGRARNQAALLTDESWKYLESGSVSELLYLAEQQERADLICMDLTMKNSIPAAELIRASFPAAYMILIADAAISPVRYMRPSIQAESLMLKPLDRKQMDTVLREAIGVYVKRMREPGDRPVFVVENKGERNLIEYSRILFFESREKKVFLSTETEEYGFYHTLDELERELQTHFIRCHRGFLVNKSHIEKVELSRNRVWLDDGTEIPLSRSCKPALRIFLETSAGRKELS